MKNKYLPLLVLSLVLASCGTTTSESTSESKNTEPSASVIEPTIPSSSNESSTSVVETKTLKVNFNEMTNIDGLQEEPSTSKSSFTLGDVNFEGEQIAFKPYYNNPSLHYLMVYATKDGAGYFNNTSSLGRIKSIKFKTTTTGSTKAKITVLGSSDASFSKTTTIYEDNPGQNEEYEIDCTGKNFGYIKFINNTPKGKKYYNFQFAYLEITYELGGGSSSPDISIPDTSTSIPDTKPSTPDTTIEEPDISIDLNGTEACKNYYKGVNFNLSGDQMRDELNARIKSKRKFQNGYTDLSRLIPQIDCPIGQEGTIYVFYKGTLKNVGKNMSFNGDINREHTWPNSRGAGKNGLGSDPFMLQPTYAKDNSSRGNDFYTNPGEGGWTPSMDEYKGDCARLIMYGYVHYFNINGVSISDLGNESSKNHTMGKISTLLDWHFKYPANKWEKERNENGDKVIGLRNPFVDFPELAAKVFKNFNSNTRKICEKYGF